MVVENHDEGNLGAVPSVSRRLCEKANESGVGSGKLTESPRDGGADEGESKEKTRSLGVAKVGGGTLRVKVWPEKQP